MRPRNPSRSSVLSERVAIFAYLWGLLKTSLLCLLPRAHWLHGKGRIGEACGVAS
jgi:hypothetical protein